MSIESGVEMNEVVERFNQWLDDYLAQGYEFPFDNYYDYLCSIRLVDFDSKMTIETDFDFEYIRDDIVESGEGPVLHIEVYGHVEYFQNILLMFDIDLWKFQEEENGRYVCTLDYGKYNVEMFYIFLHVLMQRVREEELKKDKEALDIVLERIGG